MRVFEYEPLDPVSVKGKAQPVVIWRPLEPRARLGFDVIRSLTTRPGRSELARHDPAVGRSTAVPPSSSGQLVTVVGEPGVGKSRLVRRARSRTSRPPPNSCAGARVAACRTAKGSRSGPSPRSSRPSAASSTRTAPRRPRRSWTLPDSRVRPGAVAPRPAACRCVGDTGRGGVAARSPSRRGVASAGPWSPRRPTVLVFEDLHWADDGAARLHRASRRLGDGTAPADRLYRAAGAANERQPASGRTPKLPADQPRPGSPTPRPAQLVSTLLERVILPAATRRQILERAGGNPLYAEEFVRLLADRGDEDAGTEVPEWVQA